MSEKPFRESRFYPIVFMVILTIILTSILALVYELSRKQVTANREMNFRRDLLSVFALKLDIPPLELTQYDRDKINELYAIHVTASARVEGDKPAYYRLEAEGSLLGFCYLLEMNGLWGQIDVLAGVNSEFTEVIGIRITAQNETPGLGGRITEAWFQSQFAGKALRLGDEFLEWRLVGEDDQPSAREIRQITGATTSSRAVMEGVLTQFIQIYKSQSQAGDKI